MTHNGDIDDFVFVRLKLAEESKVEAWDLDCWEGVAEEGEGWKGAWRIWLERRERGSWPSWDREGRGMILPFPRWVA